MSFNAYNFSNISTLVNHIGFAKYVLDMKKNIYMISKFQPVREKIYVRDRNLFQIRIEDTDVLDILNTVSILMSNEIYCNFFRWKIQKDNMGFKLTLPIEDYRRLQKGFTTEIMLLKNQYKLSIYKNIPKFPWVLRCLTDIDDLIYSKGIRCMYYILTSTIHDHQNSYLTIRRWKMLPKLLQHMKGWRRRIIRMDSGFLKGLITFMTPSNVKQTLFVSEAACNIMKTEFGCPIPCPSKVERFHIKVVKNDEALMNLYYKWLLTKTPENALKVFCGVNNDVEYKTSKKRKLSEDRMPRKIDEEILIHYRNVHTQGNPQPITKTNILLKRNLLDIVYYVFHVGNYSHWNHLPKCELYNTMVTIIENGVVGKFTPISTHTQYSTKNHRCLRQSDIFPIINLPKELKERLSKIKINYNTIFS